ncbi:MAG TPA: choice-of-anchor tandem repeat GloVer-containing protein [Candidatus Cybelea sp.]|nr:choice-of-anchor tandem repeat GloVer-containing protein [Candidatus Cybelea sp.]
MTSLRGVTGLAVVIIAAITTACAAHSGGALIPPNGFEPVPVQGPDGARAQTPNQSLFAPNQTYCGFDCYIQDIDQFTIAHGKPALTRGIGNAYEAVNSQNYIVAPAGGVYDWAYGNSSIPACNGTNGQGYCVAYFAPRSTTPKVVAPVNCTGYGTGGQTPGRRNFFALTPDQHDVFVPGSGVTGGCVSGAPETVNEYAIATSKLIRTYVQPTKIKIGPEAAVSIAVDGDDHLWIAWNTSGLEGKGQTKLAEYTLTSTKAIRMLTITGSWWISLQVDAAGDLWALEDGGGQVPSTAAYFNPYAKCMIDRSYHKGDVQRSKVVRRFHHGHESDYYGSINGNGGDGEDSNADFAIASNYVYMSALYGGSTKGTGFDVWTKTSDTGYTCANPTAPFLPDNGGGFVATALDASSNLWVGLPQSRTGTLYELTSGTSLLASVTSVRASFPGDYTSGPMYIPQPLANQTKVLLSFEGGAQGSTPNTTLVADSSGNLFGTTRTGGTFGHGTVFELARSGKIYKETVLHSFGGSDGQDPEGALLLTSSGELYGTTAQGGGSCQCGVLFSLTPQSGGGYSYKRLHAFAGNSDGANPMAGLAVDDATGTLYGTTEYGGGGHCSGSVGCGTIFEYVAGKHSYAQLTTFSAGSGDFPVAPLTVTSCTSCSLPELTGVASHGGANTECTDGCGTIFHTVLYNSQPVVVPIYSFGSHKGDGTNPEGPLTAVSSSSTAFVGTTSSGGNPKCDCGTVYYASVSSSGAWSEKVLHAFTGSSADGQTPVGGLVADSTGALLGATNAGGVHGAGTAFEVTYSGAGRKARESTIYDYDPSTGEAPLAGFALGSAHNQKEGLYGTASSDGKHDGGTVLVILHEVGSGR